MVRMDQIHLKCRWQTEAAKAQNSYKKHILLLNTPLSTSKEKFTYNDLYRNSHHLLLPSTETEFRKTGIYYAEMTSKPPLCGSFFLPITLLNNLHPVKSQLRHHFSTLLFNNIQQYYINHFLFWLSSSIHPVLFSPKFCPQLYLSNHR